MSTKETGTDKYSESSLLSKKITDFYHIIFLCRYKGSEVTAMIFITLMDQFNVINHVNKFCGYVFNCCGYAYLKWQGLEGTYTLV